VSIDRPLRPDDFTSPTDRSASVRSNGGADCRKPTPHIQSRFARTLNDGLPVPPASLRPSHFCLSLYCCPYHEIHDSPRFHGSYKCLYNPHSLKPLSAVVGRRPNLDSCPRIFDGACPSASFIVNCSSSQPRFYMSRLVDHLSSLLPSPPHGAFAVARDGGLTQHNALYRWPSPNPYFHLDASGHDTRRSIRRRHDPARYPARNLWQLCCKPLDNGANLSSTVSKCKL
jgi:hypothetical protein